MKKWSAPSTSEHRFRLLFAWLNSLTCISCLQSTLAFIHATLLTTLFLKLLQVVRHQRNSRLGIFSKK